MEMVGVEQKCGRCHMVMTDAEMKFVTKYVRVDAKGQMQPIVACFRCEQKVRLENVQYLSTKAEEFGKQLPGEFTDKKAALQSFSASLKGQNRITEKTLRTAIDTLAGTIVEVYLAIESKMETISLKARKQYNKLITKIREILLFVREVLQVTFGVKPIKKFELAVS